MNPWLVFGLSVAIGVLAGWAGWLADRAERRRLDRMSEAEQVQEWLDQQW